MLKAAAADVAEWWGHEADDQFDVLRDAARVHSYEKRLEHFGRVVRKNDILPLQMVNPPAEIVRLCARDRLAPIDDGKPQLALLKRLSAQQLCTAREVRADSLRCRYRRADIQVLVERIPVVSVQEARYQRVDRHTPPNAQRRRPAGRVPLAELDEGLKSMRVVDVPDDGHGGHRPIAVTKKGHQSVEVLSDLAHGRMFDRGARAHVGAHRVKDH